MLNDPGMPPVQPFSEDKPSLLVCWWITIFCTVIILLRISGRFIRSERLFVEDKVAALALIPLILRMGCVHFIIVYGTDNAQQAAQLAQLADRLGYDRFWIGDSHMIWRELYVDALPQVGQEIPSFLPFIINKL